MPLYRSLLLAFALLPAARAQPPVANPDAGLPKIGPPFEVATIRPSNPGARSSPGWKLAPSGRFTASHQPLFNLVVLGYGGKAGSANIAGDPDWGDTFDVSAKVDEAYMADWDKISDVDRLERIRPMIRALLAERFHLKLHVEVEDTPVYAVVQAKGGAKLTEVAPPAAEDPQERQARENGAVPAKVPLGVMHRTADTWTGKAIPIANLVGLIATMSEADRIVIDGTGLKGYYDFTLTLSHDRDVLLFSDLLQRQLGLKLEPRKVPMKTYVIESAEKPSLDGAELPAPRPQGE